MFCTFATVLSLSCEYNFRICLCAYADCFFCIIHVAAATLCSYQKRTKLYNK